MIPLRDITECDHCGVCCEQSPCLLGDYSDFERLEAVRPDAKRELAIEVTPDNRYIVRVSKSRPCVYFDGRCTINDVKPKGGREFECWTPETWQNTYYWTATDLGRVGFDSRRIA